MTDCTDIGDGLRICQECHGRNIDDVNLVIIHRSHVAKNARQSAFFFAKPEGGTGRKFPYHFYICEDGQIEQAVRLTKAAPGACNSNRVGIQVALCGDMRKAPPTPAQLASCKVLCSELSNFLGQVRVKGHSEVPGSFGDPNKRVGGPEECPGKCFPIDEVRQYCVANFVPVSVDRREYLTSKGYIL